jgi:hypothetical protein
MTPTCDGCRDAFELCADHEQALSAAVELRDWDRAEMLLEELKDRRLRREP